MRRTTTRSRHGHGSLTQLPNGRWKAVHSAGTDATGQRRRNVRTFDTRKQADIWLTERRQQRHLGHQNTWERQTVDHFTDWWLTHEAPLTVRHDTVNHYRYLYNTYIRPALGTRYLDTLTADDVVNLLSRLRHNGLSTNTQKRVRSNLNLICTNALRHRIIGHNPVALVKPPRATTLEPTRVKTPYTLDETTTLLRLVTGTPLETIVHLAVFLGLRRGEILGLQWSDIDTDNQTLTINRTLKEGSTILPDGTGLSHSRANPPKTANSRRTLQLPDIIQTTLKRHKNTQRIARLRAGEAWNDTGYIFTNDLGGPLWGSNVAKAFRRHLAEHKLRHIRFHDLRHTTAVLMLTHGSRLEEVSQALGHSTLGITKDIYASHVPALSHRAIHTLADTLTPHLTNHQHIRHHAS